jgi:predicted deacylase
MASSLPLSLPSQNELSDVWQHLVKGEDGIAGVISIQGTEPGPIVGISILTHGNEPAGLAAAWYLLTQIPIRNLILKGKIVFILNNMEASGRYLQATDEEVRKACRYVDINMNRLPNKNLSGSTYEEKRAQELLPLWKTLDYALDIHSTIQDSRPMVILGNGPERDALARQLGIPILLGNMLNVQSGFPVIAFYGNAGTSTLGIEAGGHTHPETMVRAIHATAKFLYAVGVLPNIAPLLAETEGAPERFNIYGKIILNHTEGQLAKVFKDFEPFQKGDLLALEPGHEHRADRDGYALFGPPQTKVMYPGEEILFLLERA